MKDKMSLLEVFEFLLEKYEKGSIEDLVEFRGKNVRPFRHGLCFSSMVLLDKKANETYHFDIVFLYTSEFTSESGSYLFKASDMKSRIIWLKKHIEILKKANSQKAKENS